MDHDYQLKVVKKTILLIISIIAIFQSGFWTSNHLRWSSLDYYITTQQEFTFSKSTTTTLEHKK